MYKVHSAVIPDLIRYPEGIEKTGFRLKDCRNDRQTNRVFKQTLIKAITLFMFLLGSLSASIVIAADEVKTGRISGKILIKDDAGPMTDGSVLFFSHETGPPPLLNRYMRTPEIVAVTDSSGKFSTALPEGKYYIGGMKHNTDKWAGPPREGDVFFISKDEDGSPKTYIVKKSEHINIGTVSGMETDKGSTVYEEITAIEGTVYDQAGNPVEDVVVFGSLRPAMDNGLAFVSGYTGADGKYSLRVHEGGTYRLMIMGEFGSVFPGSGMSVSDSGEEVDGGLILKTGEVKGMVDIKVTISQ